MGAAINVVALYLAGLTPPPVQINSYPGLYCTLENAVRTTYAPARRGPVAGDLPLTSQETRVALLAARGLSVEPGDRRLSVPEPEDGRAAPEQRVPQARLPVAYRARRLVCEITRLVSAFSAVVGGVDGPSKHGTFSLWRRGDLNA
jgi:hypothetical protein